MDHTSDTDNSKLDFFRENKCEFVLGIGIYIKAERTTQREQSIMSAVDRLIESPSWSYPVPRDIQFINRVHI